MFQGPPRMDPPDHLICAIPDNFWRMRQIEAGRTQPFPRCPHVRPRLAISLGPSAPPPARRCVGRAPSTSHPLTSPGRGASENLSSKSSAPRASKFIILFVVCMSFHNNVNVLLCMDYQTAEDNRSKHRSRPKVSMSGYARWWQKFIPEGYGLYQHWRNGKNFGSI